MQEIEFERSDEEKFARVTHTLVKTLGWELGQRANNPIEILWCFQKCDIEIFLYYCTLEGMFLRTCDDTFDLEALFDEINNILEKDYLPKDTRSIQELLSDLGLRIKVKEPTEPSS